MKYKIKKGRHYAGGWPFRILNYIMLPAEISGRFKFDESCWYPRGVVGKTGINKLFGVSYGLFGVHNQSIRIGWQPNFNKEGEIRIYSYAYKSYHSDHIASNIVNCVVGDEVNFEIIADNTQMNLVVFPFEETFNINCGCFIGHLHYPYFGGHSESPWDMAMDVEHEVM